MVQAQGFHSAPQNLTQLTGRSEGSILLCYHTSQATRAKWGWPETHRNWRAQSTTQGHKGTTELTSAVPILTTQIPTSVPTYLTAAFASKLGPQDRNSPQLSNGQSSKPWAERGIWVQPWARWDPSPTDLPLLGACDRSPAVPTETVTQGGTGSCSGQGCLGSLALSFLCAEHCHLTPCPGQGTPDPTEQAECEMTVPTKTALGDTWGLRDVLRSLPGVPNGTGPQLLGL